MIDQKQQLNTYFEQEESIDFREIIQKMIHNWYWFVICGIIGGGIGFVATKMTQAEFEVGTTLLIAENNKQLNSDFLFENMGFKSTTNAQDQIGILSSYMINLETIEQLDWKASWFRKDIFKNRDIYLNAPFEVVRIEGDNNVNDVKVNIKSVDDEHYLVEVNDNYTRGGVKYDINFESKSAYLEPFKNDYFSFIINKKYDLPEDHDEEYFFVFNDFVGMANAYRKNIEINLSDEKSNLINVKLKGANAQRAVDYLNTLSRVYIQFGLNEKNLASENTVQFIDSQLSGIVESLQQAGQDFTNFRTENRIMDLSQEAGLIMDRMREVETSQSLASMRLDYYKNLLHYLGDAKQMEQMVAPSVVGITDPSLNAMVLSLGELYSKRNALALSVQEKNPTLIALDNEIIYTQQSLQENLKSLVSNAEVEIRNLEQNKNRINAQLSKLPKTEQNMVNIKRSFDLNNELYTFLLQKRAEAAIAKASTTPDVKALDIARIENSLPVGSNKMIKLVLGLFGGLAFPVIFLFISDYFDNKINKKEDINKGTPLPVIGLISHNKLKTEFPVLKHPHAGVTETFRSLRTNLQYLLENDQPNVIAIQSMISGEGKSFVALNLAMAFAINSKKVLVVDGDLRKPQLHYPFNSKNDIGLSTFLMNKGTFEEIVHDSKIDHLSYVTTGPILRNTAELLDSEKFTHFIELARKKFDYIVINNSPISIVTDGVIVGTHADANLVILRQGFSYKEQLKTINDFAQQGFLKKISLVLNDVATDGQGYFYGQKNGYGYFNDTNSKKKQKWKFKPSKETIS